MGGKMSQARRLGGCLVGLVVVVVLLCLVVVRCRCYEVVTCKHAAEVVNACGGACYLYAAAVALLEEQGEDVSTHEHGSGEFYLIGCACSGGAVIGDNFEHLTGDELGEVVTGCQEAAAFAVDEVVTAALLGVCYYYCVFFALGDVISLYAI